MYIAKFGCVSVNPTNTNIIEAFERVLINITEAFERVVKSGDSHLAMCEPYQYQHYWSFWKSDQVKWQPFAMCEPYQY